jgi:hypothetical protein
MNRREFVKFIALIAAGASALPQQIEAFERYYEANTPQDDNELVAIDEIFISGLATKSRPVQFDLPAAMMCMGINLFGGIIRWGAMPDQKIILPRLNVSWSFTPEQEPEILKGHISFIDHNAKRHYQPITAMSL